MLSRAADPPLSGHRRVLRLPSLIKWRSVAHSRQWNFALEIEEFLVVSRRVPVRQQTRARHRLHRDDEVDVRQALSQHQIAVSRRARLGLLLLHLIESFLREVSDLHLLLIASFVRGRGPVRLNRQGNLVPVRGAMKRYTLLRRRLSPLLLFRADSGQV